MMNHRDGRSHMPGNKETFEPINILTPHPELLQPGGATHSAGAPVHLQNVPKRQAGQFTMKAKGTKKRPKG